jgi:hypothetical protein
MTLVLHRDTSRKLKNSLAGIAKVEAISNIAKKKRKRSQLNSNFGFRVISVLIPDCKNVLIMAHRNDDSIHIITSIELISDQS